MTLKISVVGLGYVGLPLAIAFSKQFSVLGFDINRERIKYLKKNIDKTEEVKSLDIKNSNASFTSDPNLLEGSDVFIITVPTPVFLNNKPDLSMLKNACKLVGKYIKKDSIVVFESTVFPGCTEEICIPILNQVSKLKFNIDYYAAFSPERINPGDKKHTFTKINKVVSGSKPRIAKKVAEIYSKVIDAEIFIASSIKVAEAAKIIENTQRDINIALMNEFSLILQRMDIKTKDVLDAANTKWNFLDFKPGLVGGHCIGVDPYYLAFKAEQLGVQPKVILSGRAVNNSMPRHIVGKVLNNIDAKKPKILILGLTFKPDCPDIRNSKVIDVISNFNQKRVTPFLYDPFYTEKPNLNVKYIFKKSLDRLPKLDAILLLVPHKKILNHGANNLEKLLKKNGYFFDMSSSLGRNKSYDSF
jgi:UDP-N-acetyl-D-galactosamine dehydrogenase